MPYVFLAILDVIDLGFKPKRQAPLLIRPQVKRQRETQKFIENLREGMEVLTQAGIIGRITKIDGNVVRLMVDEKTFIKVVKQSITGEYKG